MPGTRAFAEGASSEVGSTAGNASQVDEGLAIDVRGLSHCYGARQALDGVNLGVAQGEIFAVVGPNGGGKTTLFRILSTLIPPQHGEVRIFGLDCVNATLPLRQQIGVVFQSPSLDKHLTVEENLWHQAALYGLTRQQTHDRADELLTQLRLDDRRKDRVRELSGGLRRRVELAKGMLHRPRLLLMDEPSTGLDPGARADLWEVLQRLRTSYGVTIVLTTHLLDEAEKAQRIAIIHAGKVVAIDSPANLRAAVGGDCVTIMAADAAALAHEIETRFGIVMQQFEGRLRLSADDAGQWAARFADAYHAQIESITLAKPTLEDVFIQQTGHQFWSPNDSGTG